MANEQKQQHPLLNAITQARMMHPRSDSAMQLAEGIARYIVSVERDRQGLPPTQVGDPLKGLHAIEVQLPGGVNLPEGGCEMQLRDKLAKAEATINDQRVLLQTVRDLSTMSLPRIGKPWSLNANSWYAGITRGDLGADHHLIQTNANSPLVYCDWDKANTLAKPHGRLPTPREASLLYANRLLDGEKNLVWTNQEVGALFATAINPRNGELSHVNKFFSLGWTSVKTEQV